MGGTGKGYMARGRTVLFFFFGVLPGRFKTGGCGIVSAYS